MGLKDLPTNYIEWLPVRNAHLEADLQKSEYTTDLFEQYKKHLGTMRYKMLIEAQKLVIPTRLKKLMQFKNYALLTPVVPLYKISRLIKLDRFIKNILLPHDYKSQINELDIYMG